MECVTEAEFTSAPPPLRITEVMYHPRLLEEDARSKTMTLSSSNSPIFRQATRLTWKASRSPQALTLRSRRVARPGRTDRRGPQSSRVRASLWSGSLVAGQYGETPDSPKLDNAGETLRLEDALGGLIQEFAYDDAWVAETDGEGRLTHYCRCSGRTTTLE